MPISVYAPRRCQRGFALLEVAMLVLIAGSVMGAAYLWLHLQTNESSALDAQRALTRAEQAINGYAAVHYRLPCPDSDGDGKEDCGAAAERGQLPWHTLGMPRAEGATRLARVRYMVARDGTDLTSVSNDYEPGLVQTAEFREVRGGLIERHANAQGNERSGDTNSVLDLCRALSASADGSKPRITGSSTRSVAYALAHPGRRDKDGDGSQYDGANATRDGRMADPARAIGPAYDDRVTAWRQGDLSQALGCGQLAYSMATLSLAGSATAEVVRQHGAIEERVSQEKGLVAAHLAVVSMHVAAAGIALANNTSEKASATAKLIKDTIRCAFLDAAACARVPLDYIWIAMAVGSFATITAGEAATAASLGLLANAEAGLNDVEDQLDSFSPWDRYDQLLDRADTGGTP